MIRSMTGFGRAETNEDGKKITVEMKSVNHRYCEISTRMPKKLNFYDSAVRQLVKKYVVRGKVDVYVSLQDDSDSGCVLQEMKDRFPFIEPLDRMGNCFQIFTEIFCGYIEKQ